MNPIQLSRFSEAVLQAADAARAAARPQPGVSVAPSFREASITGDAAEPAIPSPPATTTLP